MCFIERETQNFIHKFREIFLWRETVLRAQGMKSDEKLFFCQIYAICWEKIVHVLIDMYFFFISERFEDLSYPEAITDSPFNAWIKQCSTILLLLVPGSVATRIVTYLLYLQHSWLRPHERALKETFV